MSPQFFFPACLLAVTIGTKRALAVGEAASGAWGSAAGMRFALSHRPCGCASISEDVFSKCWEVRGVDGEQLCAAVLSVAVALTGTILSPISSLDLGPEHGNPHLA